MSHYSSDLCNIFINNFQGLTEALGLVNSDNTYLTDTGAIESNQPHFWLILTFVDPNPSPAQSTGGANSAAMVYFLLAVFFIFSVMSIFAGRDSLAAGNRKPANLAADLNPRRDYEGDDDSQMR